VNSIWHRKERSSGRQSLVKQHFNIQTFSTATLPLRRRSWLRRWLYKSWSSDFWTRWSRCVRRSLPVASTVNPQLPLRRGWYLHRLSTSRQCPQLLINYAGFRRTLRRRNNDNYFQVVTGRKPNWQSSGALWGGTLLDLGSQGAPRRRRSTYFI